MKMIEVIPDQEIWINHDWSSITPIPIGTSLIKANLTDKISWDTWQFVSPIREVLINKLIWIS